MSKANTFESDLLKLIFNATPIANVADNAATAPLTNLYISLHTADPGEGGDQSSGETAYSGYARVAVQRSSAGWTVTANSVSPVAQIYFGECTALPGDSIGWFGVGAASSGPGKLFYSGALNPGVPMAASVIPSLKTTSTITED